MMNKDWTGNKQSVFSTLGAQNYAYEARESDDYYATEPLAVRELLKVEKFSPLVWECACGGGHISRELQAAGYQVLSTDIVDRHFGFVRDFLDSSLPPPANEFDIVTNPPYSLAKEFVEQAMKITPDGHKVAMFLKLQFLEGIARRSLFRKYPPKIIYVSTKRLHCAKNGDFNKSNSASAVCYAWFVWEKGFMGDPIIKWINDT